MTDPHTPTQYEVETYSGRYVDTSNPRASSICIQDIAHALSQICRYGGHSRRFYSVAEHSNNVSERLRRKGHPPVVQLAGHLHDATEAYLGDIPRPMKPLLGTAYEALTAQMDAVIVEALELPFHADAFHCRSVKDADSWMLIMEARHLLPSKGINWSGSQLDAWGVRNDGLPSRIVTPDYWQGGIAPEDAKQQFLDRYRKLWSDCGLALDSDLKRWRP